jgi:perosamine synthetase
MAQKRELFAWYKQELEGLEEVTLNQELPGAKNGYWMVTTVLDRNYGIEKDDLQERMSARGIDCRPFFRPLSSLPAYEQLAQAHEARARNRVAYEICPYGINLPSGLNLTRAHVRYVCEQFKELLGQ